MDKDQLGASAHRKVSKSCDISGADFCKFYQRPLDSNYKPGDVISEPDEVNNFSICHANEKSTEKFLSKSTQTDYRESEVQTYPWDPPYKVSKVLKEPEVLSLRNFSYGSGLPAGLLEVNYISKTRELRKEKLELGSTETENWTKKKQNMFDQVKSDWNYRKAVLNQKQLEKLTLMQSALKEELMKHSDKKEKLLWNIFAHKGAELSKTNMKLEKKLQKELNALEISFPSQNESDFTKDTHDLKKKMTFTRKKNDGGIDYMLSAYFLSNPKGLSELKSWLGTNTNALTTEIPIPRGMKWTTREKLAVKAYENILEKKKIKMPPKVYREDYVKEETPVPTVKAGDVLEIFDSEEKTIDLVTVWQQALRGLACQKQMLELIDCHKGGLSKILAPLYPGIDGT